MNPKLTAFYYLLIHSLSCSFIAFSQPKVENLGNSVNSEYNEINPVISPDGKTLFFARVSHPQNAHGLEGSQDIWFSELINNQWGLARRMTAPINREEYNCAYSITPDGNTLLIMGAYEKGTYQTRGFSFSKRTANGWSAPQKLAIAGLEGMSKGEYMCGFLSNDSKTLVMAFSEKKKSTKDDIYVSFQQKNGTWSKPVSLGIDVNTDDFTETTPFLAADGATLYFSSDRTGGQGSNDIYYTKRIDKTWKRWSKPVNLGPAINTDGYDAYYTIAAAGDYAYMVSKKNTLGKGDIVKIKIKSDEPSAPSIVPAPEPVVLVSGKVVDTKTGKPIDARIIYENLADGTEVGTAQTDPRTGEYKIVLPKGMKYGVRAVAKDFIAEAQNIDLTNVTGYKEVNGTNLKLVPIEINEVGVLNNLFFDTGKAEIRPESNPELDRMVLTFNENPGLVLEIGGHTDNVGSDASNIKLSQDRADSVREYFIGKGIEPDRIQSKGYGESKPKASNDTDEGKQINRRVEFKILKK
ncbi:OmpA family protein [Runella slithyformis]|uniref:OmpA/MotB domain protein n=1 Tax=Runella slithyformis (strain ATCC 29530 / DSM 19594 / LMG 11500 / NCIMB 11436 / LSU 4) TaxID=761193 RepID=A0A7U4E541_RUNSL|nr:OmpA family protein [Runella slithyformis]AEI48176.1 OmpA/MotB domain protein [Runella slithyformis DSM 19594]